MTGAWAPFSYLVQNNMVKRWQNDHLCQHVLMVSSCFQTVDDFDIQLQNMLQKKYAGVAQGIMPEGYLEAPLAYDAIWAIALGKSYLLLQHLMLIDSCGSKLWGLFHKEFYKYVLWPVL